MKLTIITFLFTQPRKWAQLRYGKYSSEHVNALWRACRENIGIPHRFLCLTDDAAGVECETREVWPAILVDGEDACYRRLHAFDAEWQRSLGTEFILLMDLDAIFLGDATDVITAAMERDFTILRGSAWADGTLCNHYNGSMWLCRAGARPKLWTDFNPATFAAQRNACKMPGGRRPLGSDQAWISVASGGTEATWGPEDGVVQYRTVRGPMPPSAKILFFAGREKPWSREVKRRNPEIFAAWQKYN